MKPLDPSIRIVWMIRYLIWTFVLSAGLFVYDLTRVFSDRGWILPFGVAALLLLCVGVALSIFVPRLRYRFWRYELLPDELYLERGVLNRVRTIVPLRRLQHLDVSQNIVEREFGLGKLIVHTAGSRSADVVVPGLRYEEAERLRDQLKHYILEDVL
jgi:uncharacterized protein